MRYQTALEFRDALVEAGDVNPASINRLSLPPPPILPENTPAENQDAALEPDAAQRASRQRSSHARRRRVLMKRFFVGIPLAAVAILIIVLLSQSQFAIKTPIPTQTPVIAIASTTTSASATPGDIDEPTPASTQTPPLATPTILPTPTVIATSISAGLPQIAFTSNRSGSYQIWLMNADGSHLIQLTNNPSGACLPAWSPDGIQIAFIAPCLAKDNYAGGRIFAMNADGKNIHPLPIPNNLEGDYDPAWSPDGKKLAFTSRSGNLSQLYEFNFDTSETVNISNSKSLDSNPAWSPDGKLIAFTRESVSTMIWLMDDQGDNQAQLYPSGSDINSFGPAWTPDGKFILFSQNASSGIPWLAGRRLKDQSSLGGFRIPANGSDIGPVAGVNVSQDGEWIVYESWPNGKNHNIFLVTINGTDLTPLTTDPAFDFSPAFRPK
jgi:dipeptidyl aminopeptidase/acylaminoacyl peptidase